MPARNWIGRSIGLLAIAMSTALMSCEAPKQLGPGLVIEDLIPRVTTVDGSVAAVLHTGPAPAAGTGNVATITGVGSVVNGGSSQVTVTGGQSYNSVIISVAGFQNYWELTLPSGVTASDLVVGIAPDLSASSFDLLYGLVSSGAIGAYASQSIRVTRVGTGDVQISVSWTGASDVDLHVYDPANEEVYFGHKIATSGGTLDLDSNPACVIDNVNNENIVWPTDMAPRGTYRVVVAYYDDCGVPQSDYVVTVQMKGQNPRVFTGSFIGLKGAGNPDAAIGTFTY